MNEDRRIDTLKGRAIFLKKLLAIHNEGNNFFFGVSFDKTVKDVRIGIKKIMRVCLFVSFVGK